MPSGILSQSCVMSGVAEVSEDATAVMDGPNLIVDGAPLETAARFDVIDPATGKPFTDAPLASREDLDRAVAAARGAFPGWAALAIDERAQAILAIADALEAAKDELARSLSREQGKPVPSAIGEIYRY